MPQARGSLKLLLLVSGRLPSPAGCDAGGRLSIGSLGGKESSVCLSVCYVQEATSVSETWCCFSLV